MNIKINLTNRYGYDLALYPYDGGANLSGEGQRIAKLEGTGELVVAQGESSILEVPGMGSLLVQFLGEQKLEDCHERFCDSPSEFDQYEMMALLRYKTTELYWRFPKEDSDAALDISINDIGTVCLDKVLSGEARRVQLPEFFIPPVFTAHLPEGNPD
ncbi:MULTISPECIES: hypothetical protein [unclassified Pseudoalteromonas]|uniref:hypothetical protein n=1 Tax=unclassified Pseudoalteromonas TaxID=194690 RepID=UPI00209718FB|nr:hypothetical protein [Pseudoalteromonas sp. XMcav2-N]MCO7188989.1 hypothetical protein [Pseudoalteromonas sp. XMcav2-N]